MSAFNFRDLVVWQRGIDLSVGGYEVTRKFPKHETYGLTSQMRRAAVSVPANIAEGHGRKSTKEFLRYLSIAEGSLSEVITFIVIARRLEYIDDTESADFQSQTQELLKMLHGLQRSLRAKLP